MQNYSIIHLHNYTQSNLKKNSQIKESYLSEKNVKQVRKSYYFPRDLMPNSISIRYFLTFRVTFQIVFTSFLTLTFY